MKCAYCAEEAPAFVADVCYQCVEYEAANGRRLEPTPPRMGSEAIARRIEATKKKILTDDTWPGRRAFDAYSDNQSWVDTLTVGEWVAVRLYRAMEQEVEHLTALLYLAKEHERRATVDAEALRIRVAKTKAAS